MFFAHGNYVKISNLNIDPAISPEQAKDCFAEFENIPLDSITRFFAELMIKEIASDTVSIPQLVYRIYLFSEHKNNNYVGFIDAQTCGVLLTEPALIDFSATGTFATRYSGSRQGITQNYSGTYHLADSTRGAIIHTWNLDGSTNIQNRIDLSDDNNNWTSTEHASSENDMGLDIHWALQQIYDHLNNVYGINSFNDNGFPIDAHIHYGTSNIDRDNAGWNPTLDVLVFGDGAIDFRPVACLDAVAHEFGHGITGFQIGWGITGDPRAFSEGLSDIWGAILESRIRPNSTWQIGEQITLNKTCLRNLQSTNDPNAFQSIANTFGSTQYNSGDSYVRGGVFSHWLYLLVNGGSGTNEISNNYTVYGVGMDMAENLIAEAVFNNYLDNTISYTEIRTAMVNAARTLCTGQNSLLVNQVENAWYSVGVGPQVTQMSLTGPSLVCSSGTTFTVNNLPIGCLVSWDKSSNLNLSSQSGSNATFTSISSGSGWVRATINSGCGQIILPQKVVWVGVPWPGSIQGPAELPNGCIASYAIAAQGNPTTYQWYIPGKILCPPNLQWQILYGGNQSSATYFAGCQSGYMHVTIGNIYGTAPPVGKYVDIDNSYNCNGMKMLSDSTIKSAGIVIKDDLVIYPNSASDFVQVSIVHNTNSTQDPLLSDANSNQNISDSYSVRVYNIYGILMYTLNKTSCPFTIPVGDFINGTYIINVSDNTNSFRKQFVVKH